MFKLAKILVTGASGFLGQNLCERLNSLNRHFVFLDRTVRCEDSGFKEWLDTQEFDIIYHLGSPTKFRRGQLDADNTISGVKNIISYAKNHNTHVVFPSTAAVYGDSVFSRMPSFTETDLTHPFSLYHATKLVAESLFNYHIENVTILRISNGYGDHEEVKGSNASLVTQLCQSILSNRPVQIYGEGKAIRDYIYVSDIIDVMVDATDTHSVGTFNVGSGVAISAVELTNSIAKVTGKLPILQFTDDKPFNHIGQTKIDMRKLRRWHGKQTQSIEEGIKKTISYLEGVT